MKIYGFSGLGADERVFEYLDLNCEFIPVNWIDPRPEEAIEEYCKRLIHGLDIPKSDQIGILGVSFGGLIAIEVSKLINPKFCILISSVETRNDLRSLYKGIGKTGIINLIPSKLLAPPKKIAHFLFGTNKKDLLNSIMDDTDLNFLKWALSALMNWKNEEVLPYTLKIGGTKDRLLPSKSKNTVLIEGGEHFMIVDRAEEISEIINRKIELF